jgi:hypothetical protein
LGIGGHCERRREAGIDSACQTFYWFCWPGRWKINGRSVKVHDNGTDSGL